MAPRALTITRQGRGDCPDLSLVDLDRCIAGMPAALLVELIYRLDTWQDVGGRNTVLCLVGHLKPGQPVLRVVSAVTGEPGASSPVSA